MVLDQGIDTSTAIGRMFFQILGAIAEFEHALMSERTMDGLAAAHAAGMRTVCFAPGGLPAGLDKAPQYAVTRLDELVPLLTALRLDRAA